MQQKSNSFINVSYKSNSETVIVVNKNTKDNIIFRIALIQ